MSGAMHDLGGRPGYGRVPHDPDEPPFHHDWERRVFGLLGPALAGTEPGEFRHALERLHESDYFDHGYYGRWLAGFEVLLAERGLVEGGAIDERLGFDTGSGPVARSRAKVDVPAGELPEPVSILASPARGARRVVGESPAFSVGDRVVASMPADRRHTRIPEYVAGVVGVVEKVHPAEVLPDASAHGHDERAVWIYCVGYDAAALWGGDAEPNATMFVDLYEPYLTSADPAPEED